MYLIGYGNNAARQRPGDNDVRRKPVSGAHNGCNDDTHPVGSGHGVTRFAAFMLPSIRKETLVPINITRAAIANIFKRWFHGDLLFRLNLPRLDGQRPEGFTRGKSRLSI
jgi:hypothetical protein